MFALYTTNLNSSYKPNEKNQLQQNKKMKKNHGYQQFNVNNREMGEIVFFG